MKEKNYWTLALRKSGKVALLGSTDKNGRPAVRPLLPCEFRRSTNRNFIQLTRKESVEEKWVSLRLRIRASLRRPELLCVSEDPRLHRLSRDNSRHGTVCAVTQPLLTEWWRCIGRLGQIGLHRHIHNHSRNRDIHNRSRNTGSHNTDSHSRNIRKDIPNPTMDPSPNPTTTESRNHL
jgi:hypothetical protein